MKKMRSVIAVMIAASMASTVAQATGSITNNGTLTITSQINPVAVTTCNMELSSRGSIVTTVELLPMMLSTFAAVGNASDFIDFNLAFTSCPAAMVDNSSAKLALNGTADGTAFKNMNGTEGATGVAIQIQETTGLVSNMEPGAVNDEAYTVMSGGFTVPLQANIIRISAEALPVTPGSVAATPTIQIDYQ